MQSKEAICYIVYRLYTIMCTDDAKKFTSEMHDLCVRSHYLQKRTKQEHLTEGTGVEPAKHPLKVKSNLFTTLEC